MPRGQTCWRLGLVMYPCLVASMPSLLEALVAQAFQPHDLTLSLPPQILFGGSLRPALLAMRARSFSNSKCSCMRYHAIDYNRLAHDAKKYKKHAGTHSNLLLVVKTTCTLHTCARPLAAHAHDRIGQRIAINIYQHVDILRTIDEHH